MDKEKKLWSDRFKPHKPFLKQMERPISKGQTMTRLKEKSPEEKIKDKIREDFKNSYANVIITLSKTIEQQQETIESERKLIKPLVDALEEAIIDIDNYIAQNPMAKTILPDTRNELNKALTEAKGVLDN